MKPVIRKQTHYNLVLMRDDTHPRTMRLSDTTLRTGIFGLVFLFLFCFSGIAGGVYYWKKYRGLQEKHAALEKETADMRLQLERLVTLETLITASNGQLPHAPIKHEEVGVPAPVAPATLEDMENGGPVAGKDAAAEKDESGGDKAEGGGAAGAAADTPAEDPQALGEASAVALVTTANAVTGAGTAEVQGLVSDAPPSIAPEEGMLLLVDEQSPLRITGFAARYGGPQLLRITYDLVASQPGAKTFSGSVEYFVTMKDGTRLVLPMQDGQNRRFSISRRKRIQAPTRIPAPYNINEVQDVDVVVELGDGVRYHQIFAVK